MHPLRRSTDRIPSTKPARKPLTSDEIDTRCKSALILAFSDAVKPKEEAAATIKAKPRTVKNWFESANGMSLDAFINMARCGPPEFRAEALRLLGMDAADDIERPRDPARDQDA